MNKSPKSTRSDSEPSSAKHARHQSDKPIEAKLGNRTTATVLETAHSQPGRPLDAGVQMHMESAFGENFGGVRIHTQESLPTSVRAAATGRHIVFGRGQYAPGTERGRQLIAHELAHVVQHSRTTGDSGTHHLEPEADRAAGMALTGRRPVLSGATTQSVQFKIEPEDAAPELVGQTFEVITKYTSGATTLDVGDKVTVTKLDAGPGHAFQVTVATGKSAGTSLTVPQKVLKPSYTPVAGIAPYSAGVSKQAQAVEKAEAKLAAFQATKSQYKTAKQQALFTAEETRQQNLLTIRRDALNRKEIQETHFNRFDATITAEVRAANTAHGFTGKDALDPNLVKAQLFEESELGTAGQFMSVPPSHPITSRFNLGQVIDSSGLALLTLMEAENQPLIAKYKLATLRTDLATAQTEKAKLEAKHTRTAGEDARLNDLNRLSGQNWERFIWAYKAPGETKGFSDAVNELFASGGATPKNLDYTFWIHVAVMWLFEKKKKGMSWEDAIKAYNGSGARAEHYKQAIAKRASGAAAKQAAGQEFIPGH